LGQPRHRLLSKQRLLDPRKVKPKAAMLWTPDEASQFCGSLKSAGGQRVVQRN
jgi:hypothetical protein